MCAQVQRAAHVVSNLVVQMDMAPTQMDVAQPLAVLPPEGAARVAVHRHPRSPSPELGGGVENRVPRPLAADRAEGSKQHEHHSSGRQMSGQRGSKQQEPSSTQPAAQRGRKRSRAAEVCAHCCVNKQQLLLPVLLNTWCVCYRSSAPLYCKSSQGDATTTAATARPSNSAGMDTASPPTCVVLSCMHTDQQQAQTRLLKRLGIPAASIVSGKATHRWDARATHVVMPTLKRVTKSMAGMAAGCWLVSMSYIEDSAEKGELLDPVRPSVVLCRT